MTQTLAPPRPSSPGRDEVAAQVQGLLARSASFNALPPQERARILADTTAVARTMVENRLAQTQAVDPFAVPMDATVPGMPTIPGLPTPPGQQQQSNLGLQGTGGATQRESPIAPQKAGDFGSGIALGVAEAGEMLRQVNFPEFVAELIRGVFQAVVDASIQQMKAYGELVQSVAMSLNDFRDQNVSPNQGRDHLVSKYPNLFQINVNNGQPQVGLRPGAEDADVPDFQSDLGVSEQITSLDEDTAEEYLVMAARNDLAKSRQSLLATMLLMGINRIIVTDGRINAKLNFSFHASDDMTTYAQKFDYQNMGTTTVSTSTKESSEDTGSDYQESGNWWSGRNRSGESSRWSRGTDTVTSAPVINLTGLTQTQTDAAVGAEGSLRSEVVLNFKSDVVDLNKLATSSELFSIQQNQRAIGGGRGAPAAGATGTTGGTPASTGGTPGAAGTAPAQQPAGTGAP